jgi:DNA polymerase I-like protein with 3'-5' exonuclease and polymerase domains
MALVYRRLRKFNGTAFIIASIHDELLVECDEADGEEVAKIVQEAMLEAMDGIVNAEGDPVPIKVSGGVTKVWTKD